jgi:NADH-quinone oxidoreductase subunit H
MVCLAVAFFALAALFLIPAVNAPSAPVFWFLLKLFLVLYVMIWLRGTFPRYRYDQLMNIGWKVMIPTALGALFVNALVGILRG